MITDHCLLRMLHKRFIRSRFLVLLVALSTLITNGISCCYEDDEDDSYETFSDSTTGLMWTKKPSFDYLNWIDAKEYCEQLSKAGHNDWRLPSISELRTLLVDCNGSMSNGSCPVTDQCTEGDCQSDACYGCVSGEGSNDGCFGDTRLEDGCLHYWSSSLVMDNLERAWAIGFSSAFIYKPRVYYSFRAICVR